MPFAVGWSTRGGEAQTGASVRALRRDCFPKPNPGGKGCEERDEPDYKLYIIGYLESH